METTNRSTHELSTFDPVEFLPIDPASTDPRRYQVNFYIPGFETSFEEITPNSTGSHKAWKSFEHYKRSMDSSRSYMNVDHHKTFDYGGFGNPYSNYFSGDHHNLMFGYYSQFGAPGNPTEYLQPMYVKRPDGGFVPPPSNLEQLISKSLGTMLPIIKAELSLVNSVIELKDFRSLPRTLLNVKNAAVKGARTLREAFRSSADGYLQAKFNVLPLLSDISGLHRAMASVEKRLNRFITESGRVQSKHYAFNWVELANVEDSTPDYSVSFPPTSGFPSMLGECRVDRFVSSAASTFHAQIEFNYNYSQYQLLHARELAILDAFGVNLNPAIIWNAIPWSFVLDWLLSIGKFLDQFKVENMRPTINIHRYLWSIKRERRIQLVKFLNYTNVPSHGPINYGNPMPVVVESSYRRQVTLPSLSSIQSSGLSSEEVSLAAALVLSRRRRSKQR